MNFGKNIFKKSWLLPAKRLEIFQVSAAFKDARENLENFGDVKFVNRAREMWKDMGLEEDDADFKTTRIGRVKRMSGETDC